MKITKENIESFIFDYHEGNLSDSDKAEVLNFIHQHPEYENDFTQWAQSYFHAEDPIKNYGIADTLVQRNVINWYANKWVLSVGGIALLVIGLYSYLLLTKSETHIQDNRSTPVNPETQIQQIERIEKTTPSVADMNQKTPENQNAIRSGKTLGTATSESNYMTTLTDDDTLVHVHTNDASVNNPDQKNIVANKDAVAKVDTIQNNTPIQHNSDVKTKKTASKHKSKLDLKPDAKFIPTNPDF